MIFIAICFGFGLGLIFCTAVDWRLDRRWRRKHGPHVLIDMMDGGGPNEWRCTCGDRIWPDCDISIASVNTAFEEHLAKVGR